MVLTEKPQALDRDLQPINIGDHVRFIARGFFHPREQESFGKVIAIDECGGIKITMISGYKHFLTSKKVGHIAETFYFTHHRYDVERHARVYFVEEGKYELFISIFECFKETAT